MGESQTVIKFGSVALTFLMPIVLAYIYSFFPNASNRIKMTIPMMLGFGLAALAIWYNHLAWTIENCVDYAIAGFLQGAEIVGIYGTFRALTTKAEAGTPPTK